MVLILSVLYPLPLDLGICTDLVAKGFKVLKIKGGRGVGCVEAPRGTLIHDYTADDDGMITSANLIVGTTHNQAPINLSVRQAASALIKDGAYDLGVLNQIEMAIRAYDP